MRSIAVALACFGFLALVIIRGHKFLKPNFQLVAALVLYIAGLGSLKIGIGTFIIDPFMLTFLGYVSTRSIYRENGPITRLRPKKFWRKFLPALLPANIIVLWVLGALAYANIITSVGAYAHLIPLSAIGTLDGNDFMWNGFIMVLFGKRLVPLGLIPTYNHCQIIQNAGFLSQLTSLFTLWGIVVWLSMPVILGWAAVKGNGHAVANNWPAGRWYKAAFIMALKGLALSLLTAAITALLVQVCS
jgi:hypothetical protein